MATLVGSGGVGEVPRVAPGFDLLAALREGHDLVPGEPFDVGDTVVDLLPADPEPFGEPATQLGFVQVAGRELVAVQEPPVDGPPHTVDTLDPVPDHDVGVELRVVGPAGELGEPRRDIPVAADRPGLDPIARRPVLVEDRLAAAIQDRRAGGTTGRRRHRLQIGNSFGGGLLERLEDVAANLVVAGRPQQRHRLVRRELRRRGNRWVSSF